MPEVFDRVKIWTSRRPVHNPNIFISKKLLCNFRGVWPCIIVLKPRAATMIPIGSIEISKGWQKMILESCDIWLRYKGKKVSRIFFFYSKSKKIFFLFNKHFILPLTEVRRGTRVPTPNHEKHPQCIRLGLWLTVAERHLAFHSSRGLRQTRHLLPCWNWVNVDSSLQTTFLKSRTVQSLRARHQVSRSSIFLRAWGGRYSFLTVLHAGFDGWFFGYLDSRFGYKKIG